MTFNPLANDTDVDGTLDGSTVIFINPPAGATLSPDGKTLTVPGGRISPCCQRWGKSRSARRRILPGTTTSVTYQSGGQRRRDGLGQYHGGCRGHQ
ncbi:MAG: hypothetical protein R3C28_31275 [Pirellulaceae bacterium]